MSVRGEAYGSGGKVCGVCVCVCVCGVCVFVQDSSPVRCGGDTTKLRSCGVEDRHSNVESEMHG